MLFICFQRLQKFDHFSRSPRRNTRNYLSPVESRGRSTTLRHFHLSSQGRSVHFRCSNSMEFGRSSSSFSFSLKVKKLLAKIAQCPIPRFLMFSRSQERTPSVSKVPSALSHRLRPSPHCRFNVQNWSAEQRPRHHYPAGPKTPFLTGRKGFCESRV